MFDLMHVLKMINYERKGPRLVKRFSRLE